MESQINCNQEKPFRISLGVILVMIIALFTIFTTIKDFLEYPIFSLGLVENILSVISIIAVVVCLFLRRRDLPLAISLGVFGLCKTLPLIFHFFAIIRGMLKVAIVYRIMYLFFDILQIVATAGVFILLVLIILIKTHEKFKHLQEKFTTFRDIFYVALGARYILFLVSCILDGFNLIAIFHLIFELLLSITLLVVLLWIINPYYPEDLSSEERLAQSKLNKYNISLPLHVILTVFTGIIWQIIWSYKITAYTNFVEGEKIRTPEYQVFLCILIPIYNIFWIYNTAQRVDRLASSESPIATLCLIFSIFIPIIAPILIQNKINRYIETSK